LTPDALNIQDVAARLAHDTTALCRNIAILTDILIEDAGDPVQVVEIGAQLRAKSGLLFSLVRTGRRVTDIAVRDTEHAPADLAPIVAAAVLRNAGRLGGLSNSVTGSGTAQVDIPLLNLALDAVLENVGDHGSDAGVLSIHIKDGRIELRNPASRAANSEDFDAFSGRDIKAFGGLGLWLVREVMARHGGRAEPLTGDATTYGVALQFA